MGRLFLECVDAEKVYMCSKCRTHVSSFDQIASKAFQGRRGKAYLFNNVVNIDVGPEETKTLTTGMHKVCDIFCLSCNTILGWKYTYAYEESQKYKVGKFILERENIQKVEGDLKDD